jgi:hypothetical protein
MNFIQAIAIAAVFVFVVLCIAVRPFREWLFGQEIGARRGFPRSRRKHP